MKKSEYVNEQLMILFNADVISSKNHGNIYINDSLRVEMSKRLMSAVKKNASENYPSIAAAHSMVDDVREQQIDFVDDIDRDYTAGAGEEDLSKDTVKTKRKK